MSVAVLTPEDWSTRAGGFIALWTDAASAYALYDPAELVAVPLAGNDYPALSPNNPGAAWFERLAHDLNGANAKGATDTRPAIEHFRAPDGSAAWPDFPAPAGDGVHQVAVGPIHAAIIEPGHFRFSVLGEQVLKLEARLGYSHKGTLALIRGKSPRLAARFAARVSGDATVAHAMAFAHAAEAALALDIPARARHLRAICAEIERLANHTSDIGAIAGDAGFAFLDARFAWHREGFCAAAAAAFGHRLMMDAVIPGGMAGDINTGGAEAITDALDELEAELPSLQRVFEDYASLQDRLVGTGIIPPALAAAYNAGGPAGRASGRQVDARLFPGYPPYNTLELQVPVETDGDIAARVRIRLAELVESTRLLRILLHTLPDGQIAIAPPSRDGIGLGVAESFRGPVWHWLAITAGTITDAFIADASALHWPLLEQAARAGILADFPLINKSINASYSGVDL
jgi:Ni,Fe-hydrogenase III large subunit